MTVMRMDNVGIVVEDLDANCANRELGLLSNHFRRAACC
jgi:hypothetical protein